MMPLLLAVDLLEPLRQGFVIQVLILAGLIGVVCAVLSCYLVLKGWALMGDAISHAVLPGIILAYVLGIPLTIGAFASGMLCAVGTGWIKARSRIKEDTVMGIVFTGLFALGLILMSRVASDVHFDQIIRGSLLGIHKSDMIQVYITSAVTLGVVLLKRKDLMLLCFDQAQAKSVGLNTTFLYYLLLTLLAATTVAALQAVGIILTVAMLITPGSIAFMWTSRFDRMLLIASSTAVVAAVVGTYISYFFDGSAAGFIVLMQSLFFIITIVFAPKHGLIARRRTLKAALDQI